MSRLASVHIDREPAFAGGGRHTFVTMTLNFAGLCRTVGKRILDPCTHARKRAACPRQVHNRDALSELPLSLQQVQGYEQNALKILYWQVLDELDSLLVVVFRLLQWAKARCAGVP
jgi:hypothetical protein